MIWTAGDAGGRSTERPYVLRHPGMFTLERPTYRPAAIVWGRKKRQAIGWDLLPDGRVWAGSLFQYCFLAVDDVDAGGESVEVGGGGVLLYQDTL